MYQNLEYRQVGPRRKFRGKKGPTSSKCRKLSNKQSNGATQGTRKQIKLKIKEQK